MFADCGVYRLRTYFGFIGLKDNGSPLLRTCRYEVPNQRHTRGRGCAVEPQDRFRPASTLLSRLKPKVKGNIQNDEHEILFFQAFNWICSIIVFTTATKMGPVDKYLSMTSPPADMQLRGVWFLTLELVQIDSFHVHLLPLIVPGCGFGGILSLYLLNSGTIIL